MKKLIFGFLLLSFSVCWADEVKLPKNKANLALREVTEYLLNSKLLANINTIFVSADWEWNTPANVIDNLVNKDGFDVRRLALKFEDGLGNEINGSCYIDLHEDSQYVMAIQFLPSTCQLPAGIIDVLRSISPNYDVDHGEFKRKPQSGMSPNI